MLPMPAALALDAFKARARAYLLPAALICGALLIGGALLWAHHLGGTAASQREAFAVAQATELRQRIERAHAQADEDAKLIQGLGERLATLDQKHQQLVQRISHARLAATTRVPRAAVAAAASAPCALAAAAAQGAPGPGAADAVPPGRGPIQAGPPAVAPGGVRPDATADATAQALELQITDVQLTALAVSLWNSALAGRDVAAGACRPDDAASPACAAATAVGLNEAWANHAANARSCAADRERFAALQQRVRMMEGAK